MTKIKKERIWHTREEVNELLKNTRQILVNYGVIENEKKEVLK